MDVDSEPVIEDMDPVIEEDGSSIETNSMAVFSELVDEEV
jgi:hypothetical protein